MSTRCSASYSEGKKTSNRRKFAENRAIENDQRFKTKHRTTVPKWKDRQRDQRPGKPKKNVTGTFFSARTFEECSINDDIQSALLKMSIDRPSHIQVIFNPIVSAPKLCLHGHIDHMFHSNSQVPGAPDRQWPLMPSWSTRTGIF